MKLSWYARRSAPIAVVSLGLFTFAACGGTSGTDITGNGDNANDGGAGSDANGGNADASGGNGNDGGGGAVDGGADAAPSACVAPKSTSCKGTCVDTKTDDANCGGCGIACATGCSNGICALAGGDGGAAPPVGDNACLAVDQKSVFWVNGKPTPNGAVYKVSLAGGTPTMVQGALDIPHGIATDGNDVYWTSEGSGEIWRASANGGGNAPSAIVKSQNKPIDVIAGANGPIWLNAGDGTIYESDKDGGNVTKIAGPAVSVALHNGHLRANATTVFWTDSSNGDVLSAPIQANAATTKITNAAGARFLDLDGKSIFFSAGGGATSTIDSTPFAGPTATPILSNQAASMGVAVDGVHVYWANAGTSASSGTINRAHEDGSGSSALANGLNFPACVAIDATSIYWIELGSGIVSKTAK